MRAALLCMTLLLAPVLPARFTWTPTVQLEYEQLLQQVRDDSWTAADRAGQPGDGALRLGTISAALLALVPQQSDSRQTALRVQQLQQHVAQVNLGKMELDSLLNAQQSRPVSQEEVEVALKKFLTLQEKMASSFGMDSVQQLWWSPFRTETGDLRSRLETMWSQTSPLLSQLLTHLRSRPAPAGQSMDQLVLACAAQGNCTTLVKMATPYPDVSTAIGDLLREKRMTAEELAHLADAFLVLLGLPAAPNQLWSQSQYGVSGECANYVDGEKVRLCTGGDVAGLKTALTVMSDSEYWRTVAAQQPPFNTAAFPGFERAVSECVQLLALRPLTVQQLVYGYRHGHAAPSSPVSLYLARGARPSGPPDSICRGDVGCQQTANWLMETAVNTLLPLGYHSASVRWLEEAPTSPAPLAAWRRSMQHTLRLADAGSPAAWDALFYDAGRHASALLTSYAGFQLRSAACRGGADCLVDGSGLAGELLSAVMSAGSEKPWDALLTQTTGTSSPTAAPLVTFFEPLRPFLVSTLTWHRATLLTMELDDDAEIQQDLAGISTGSGPGPVFVNSSCSNITDADKTSAESIVCTWNALCDSQLEDMNLALWNLGGEITSENATQVVASEEQFLMSKNASREALRAIPSGNWTNDPPSADEENLYGQMIVLNRTDVGDATNDTLHKILNSTTEMLMKYTGVMVCPSDKKSCSKDSEKLTIWDLRDILANCTSEEELQYYWQAYRDAAKSDLASAFQQYVDTGNAAAKDVGLDHYGQLWLQPYGNDSETLLQQLADSWDGLADLYKNLHAYVRCRLKDTYPHAAPGDQDPLPSHLLGDMFAENWMHIYNSTLPFDNYSIDITDELIKNGYTAEDMRKDAIDFLNGMSLIDLSQNNDFMNNSDLSNCSKQKDCDPMAWTAGVGDDVRVRIVPSIDMDTYEAMHFKTAELEYYLEYMSLDPAYRAPANPAFTAAVGGAISLSVLTPSHLNAVGLIDTADQDDLFYVNYLYRRALQYLVPLPFDFVTHSWQWGVFNGSLTSSNRWEHRWWEIREQYQGVRPAVGRHDSDLDPLAVPAVARDVPAFQRYMATLLQFQLFEHFCVAAGQYSRDGTKPLHMCDLSKWPAAELRTLMQAGNSQRWQDLLQAYTENGTLSADSMLTYFAPLDEHLKEFITDNNLKPGWKSDLDNYFSTDTDNTVPIVVGVVLGVLVLIVVVAYVVVRVRRGGEE